MSEPEAKPIANEVTLPAREYLELVAALQWALDLLRYQDQAPEKLIPATSYDIALGKAWGVFKKAEVRVWLILEEELNHEAGSDRPSAG